MRGSVSLLNFGFCSNYNFLVKQVISCYRHTTHTCAFHIDSTTLADGTYELVPESESEQREAQVNLTEATEDPNLISEEPRTSYAQEGNTFEDMIASLTWPCTLPPGWSVEWDPSPANDDKSE